MSTNIIPFDFNEMAVRVIELDGQTWFVASDVSRALEYSDAHKMTQKLDADEKANRQIGGLGSPLGGRGTTLINESGLYSLILSSRKPSAKRFKKWVTSVVLPSIRKSGSYSTEVDSPAPILEFQAAEVAARMLRIGEPGKIQMLSTICKEKGISTAFLPEYAAESLVKAIGDLLKEHDAGLSARAANNILMDMGLLEEMERRSSGGKPKNFKSVTEEGLRFGRNDTSPQSPNQTQPRYYVSKFPELLVKIQDWMSQNSAA